LRRQGGLRAGNGQASALSAGDQAAAEESEQGREQGYRGEDGEPDGGGGDTDPGQG
jgi:hypothetical protein